MTPKPMAQKISITGTPKVALLLETSTEYGRGLLRGIVRYSRLHGPWSLYVAPGHLEQALPKAKSWNGDGIIARIHTPEVARLIRSTGLPFVASSLDEFMAEDSQNKFCQIRTESPAIARMAALHLVERGLRRFAFCGFVDCAWSSLREAIFSKQVEREGFRCEAHRIQIANWMQRSNWIQTWEHEQPLLSAWLKSLPKPVGVMACNDVCGREVLQACASAGLRVPDDVAVIGVDNDELMCELSSPPLSSVALNLENAGYKAAHLLDGLMSKRLKGKYVVQVEPTFVITRRSTDVIAQDDPMVARALQFIRDYARKPIGVVDIVDAVGTSRRTLERRFMQSIGRSILSELTRCRLERAKNLLRETRLSCHQVSVAAGFGSVKSFNRAFRHSERVSPNSFRKGRASVYEEPGRRPRRRPPGPPI
ncbi:MAG: substrate-binding domain-containing protein [Terriglobia bacterium]